MVQWNEKLFDARRFGYAPCNDWKCPGCFVVLKTARSAKRHIKIPCARFAEVEVVHRSSPLIKPSDYNRSQPDIQIRFATAAQLAGLKYAQVSQFLDLLGVNPPAATTWQSVSDLVFDSVEKITLKTMEKAREIARNDNDLWVIIDCRWASRGVLPTPTDPFLVHPINIPVKMIMVVLQLTTLMNKKTSAFTWNKKVKLL